MDTFLKNFFKGVLIGLLLLPFELLFLTLKTDHLVQAQDLREQIRSQITDPRVVRERACEEDSTESCARPIPSRPSHRPAPEPEVSPPPQPSLEPSLPAPSAPPVVSPAPAVSPSPGVGGPPSEAEECEECEEAEEEKEEKVEAVKIKGPQVLGLSYTGSGKW